MAESYPYKIKPNTPFHLERLPVYGTKERIDFFYKYKRKEENLFLGDIDKKHLLLKDSGSVSETFNSYFKNRDFEDLGDILEDFEKRLFPKICWLTDSFFKVGFQYPVSVHYNPRIEKNVIHPGSIRNYIIYLFQKTPTVNCLYFNTGGVNFDFIKSLRLFTKEELLSYENNLEIELVADHGAIIPHINLDPTTATTNILKWRDFVSRRLTSPSFSIKCNTDVELYRPWVQESANIEIVIKNTTDGLADDDVFTGMILAVLGMPYESERISITHNVEITRPE